MSRRSFSLYGTFLLVFLGMISAFGPFVTDMYLPVLPQLQTYFHTGEPLVQLSLSASMAGLAVGQIFIGPLSDKYGRRPLLLFSLWLFILSTVACLFSPDIHFFVAMRLLQGIGGAGGVVLSRSIAADRYWGEKLAVMMAVIGAINGVAPVAAPVVGGLLADTGGWRGIFMVLVAIGVLLLVGGYLMRETLMPEKRSDEGLLRTFASFRTILSNRRFVSILLQYGMTGAVFFAYISSSPFIIQQHYGFSALGFSAVFGFNALFVGVAAACSVRFHSPRACTHAACLLMLATAAAECVSLWMSAPFWVFETLAVVLVFCVGLCFTSSVVIAMNEEHENAGASSALVGAMLFASGGVVSPLVGLGDMMHTTGVVFLLCAVLSLLLDFRYRLLTRDSLPPSGGRPTD